MRIPLSAGRGVFCRDMYQQLVRQVQFIFGSTQFKRHYNMDVIATLEKTVLFIDGANFYSSARALGMDIDYAKMRTFFESRTNLLRAYYYTSLPEEHEYSPLRPLVDWLDYNGYAVVSKLMREYTDPDTGRRRVKGNMDMDIALDMLRLAPKIDHAVLFSGDGDFCRLLEDVQSMGVRVSIVSTTKTVTPMVSDSLRRMSDDFIDMDNIRAEITRCEGDLAPEDDLCGGV